MPKALTALGVDRLGVKKKLYIRRVDDNLYIKVRRDHLLSDAMQRILLLNPGEMKKRWRIVFIGEEGIDAGEMTLPSLIFICLCHTIK